MSDVPIVFGKKPFIRKTSCILWENHGNNRAVPFLERRFHNHEQQPEQQPEPEPEQQPESESEQPEPEQQPESEQPEQALTL
jgi:hypothetical protein